MLAQLELDNDRDCDWEGADVRAVLSDKGRIAQWVVSTRMVEGQVEVAMEKEQSTMAFMITEVAVAMEWCFRWRVVQHKLRYMQCAWFHF